MQENRHTIKRVLSSTGYWHSFVDLVWLLVIARNHIQIHMSDDEGDFCTEEEDNSYVYEEGDWDGDDGQGLAIDGDEDDDEYREDEDRISSRLSSGPSGVKYIESDAQLLSFFDDCIAEFREISAETYPVALSILRRFNWDKDEAVRRYLTDSTTSGGTILTTLPQLGKLTNYIGFRLYRILRRFKS